MAGGPEALQLLDSLSTEGITISILTYMEVYQGILRSPEPQRAEARLESILNAVPIAPLSPAVARQCVRLREELLNQGKRVNQRAIDLIIAATALENDFILVTRNIRDYRGIDGLSIYTDS